MAEKILSPGVFTNEIDQSFLPATPGPVGAAVVGPTVKGPILEPTVVNSYSEYINIFGELIESGSDKYQYLTSHTAKEYLRQGGPLTVVRVGTPSLNKATAVVNTSGTAVDGNKASGSLTIDGTFGQSVNDEVQITVDGTEFRFIASSTGSVADSSPIFFHLTGSNTATYLDNLVAEINAANIGVTATDATTALQLTASSAGTSGNSITVDSGSDANMSDVLTLEGGTADSSTGQTLFTLEALGNGPQFNNTSSLGTDDILTPLTSSIGNNHFTSGSFGGRADNFRWEISNKNNSKGTFTLLIRQGNDTVKKKRILETHSNLSLDPESTDYILRRIGNQTTEVATEDGVAYLRPVGEFPNKSKYVRVSNLVEGKKTPNYLDENGNITDNALSASLPALGSGSYGGAFGDVTGGTKQTAGDFGSGEITHPFNFYDNISATNSQGVNMSVSSATVGTGGYKTALSLLSNKDEYSFNLLFLPGVVDQLANHSVVITDAIQLCEDRTDCFLVYDNTSKTDSVATAKTNTEARNSSYAATYYPWVQIQDASLGVNRYVPPSTVIAGVYHFNDVVGQPWFAPAGLNRGGIDSAVQAYRKLTQANRDSLYESNVNPIATFPGQGVTVFGQKTTQKKASALDRVNVRRLLINLKTFVASSSRNLLFEQNTSSLRNQFLNVVNPYMDQVQANSGLNAYRVVMDDSNNTPETIDRNQLIGQIFIQPTRAAEFIVLDFVVQPTGAAFPE
jgi:phage tail sheath protein FI